MLNIFIKKKSIKELNYFFYKYYTFLLNCKTLNYYKKKPVICVYKFRLIRRQKDSSKKKKKATNIYNKKISIYERNKIRYIRFYFCR